jgi:hypothetical protein
LAPPAHGADLFMILHKLPTTKRHETRPAKSDVAPRRQHVTGVWIAQPLWNLLMLEA